MAEMSWRDLLRGGPPGLLAERAGRELGLDLPERFEPHCRLVADRIRRDSGFDLGAGRQTPWSDGTWRMFMKARAEELGCYEPGGLLPRTWLAGVLHVGFVGVVETEEQLERLRRPEPKPEAPREPRTARSKIGTTQLPIRPVDRVAARVGPPELSR
jgi:hypothetical protein